MKERPIIFSDPMVKKLLTGQKTQTRRIVNVDRLRVTLPKRVSPEYSEFVPLSVSVPPGRYRVKLNPQAAVSVYFDQDRMLGVKPNEFNFVCPYASGRTVIRFGKWEIEVEKEQRLWVREAWSHCTGNGIRTVYRADSEDPRTGWDDVPAEQRPRIKWENPLFMPKKESRISLLVTRVRMERLHEITEQDAIAEGVVSGIIPACGDHPALIGYVLGDDDGKCVLHPTAVAAYQAGWDKIHGADAWKKNPFVWAISFHRLADAHSTPSVGMRSPASAFLRTR